MPLTTESAARKDRNSPLSVTLEHRHFAFIAATIADLHSIKEKDRTWVADFFAEKLSGTNPRFDRARFLSACNAADRI